MENRREAAAEFRRTLTVVWIAVTAFLAFLPFLGNLVLHLLAGGPTRRRIRAVLAGTEPVPPDEAQADPETTGTVYLLAGEDSGDLHAANLVAAIRAAAPNVEIRGMGGPRMEAAGCRLDYDLVRMNVMGVLPVVRAVGTFFGLFRDLLRRFETDPPDVLVPVDYPGFNLRAARLARARGVPVVYYIAPQVWAWAPWRLRRIARLVDRMLVILPFERELYRRRGVDAAFVGHPLYEHLSRSAPPRREPAADGGVRIGLLPGSRRAEVESLLPWMLDAARRVRDGEPRATFVLPVGRASLVPLVRARIAAEADPPPIEVVEGRTHEVMAELDFALVASGTATLELAWFGVPMVVLYRISRLGAVFRGLLLIVRDIALVNIVAGRRIVPEHLTAKNPAPAAAATVLSWIRDPEAAGAVRGELAAVRRRLSVEGASRRSAGAVLRALGSVPPPRRGSPGSPG